MENVKAFFAFLFICGKLSQSEQKCNDRFNRGKTERLTIDTQLQFHNLISGQDRDMGPLVVVELKRDGLVFSPVLEMLRQLHIHPHGFSKYCMGAALTNPTLTQHRFKLKLREVEKILSA